MLNSASRQGIQQFIDTVVQRHETATGLKKLTSHEQIVDYAHSIGYTFTKSEWDTFVDEDAHSVGFQPSQSAYFDKPNHWSWAFRQISAWRAMLMEGADQGSA